MYEMATSEETWREKTLLALFVVALVFVLVFALVEVRFVSWADP